MNFWESEFAACALTGNTFVWNGQSQGTGPTNELWYIHPRRVKVGLASDQTKVFQLDGDKDRAFTSDEIMHIPALSTDGVRGISPLDSLALPINIIAAAGETSRLGYTQNQVPPGLLKTEQVLTQEQADEIQERWQQKRSGVAQSRNIAVLGQGAEFQALSVTPEQAQYIQTLEHWELQIAKVYGIPPHMLGIVDRSTSWGRGIEQQTLGFVTFTLMGGWLVRFEQAIEDEQLPPDLEMKWVLNGLLRGDTVQRFAAYRVGIASKFMVPNQARELEDWSPLPGGDEVVEMSTSNPSGLGGGGGDGGAQPRDTREARAYLTNDQDDFTEAIYQKLRVDNYGPRVEEELDGLLEEGRCPKCEKVLGRHINRGAEVECKRCKELVAVA